ncbi:MAG: prepilin-type N-terminal cleavage/methylation domain-containing protein [Thermodesulfobacteriota bacterium]
MKVFSGAGSMAGFSMIEILIALSICGIGFLAITASVIAASGLNRTTAAADQAVFWGQDMTERLAGIPLDAPELEDGSVLTLLRENQKAEITVFGAADLDGNGRDDFKTIGLRVWVKKGDAFDLKMENYYRRAMRD